MRHVKLKPGSSVDPVDLAKLIEAAYEDMQARLEADAGHGAV